MYPADREHGQQLFAEYRKRLTDFYGKTAGLKYLHVMQEEDLDTGEAFDWDDSKLVIFADRAGMTGDELHQILLKKYHLQMEMVSGYYVLGMTSLMDEDEGWSVWQAHCMRSMQRWQRTFQMETKF